MCEIKITYSAILNLGFTIVLVLQVLEIKQNALITTVLRCIQEEDRGDVRRETKKLCYDCITPANETKDGLTCNLSNKVLHLVCVLCSCFLWCGIVAQVCLIICH